MERALRGSHRWREMELFADLELRGVYTGLDAQTNLRTENDTNVGLVTK